MELEKSWGEEKSLVTMFSYGVKLPDKKNQLLVLNLLKFYLSTTQIFIQYHPSYYFFLYTTDIFRTKTDIPWIFLENKCIFCG